MQFSDSADFAEPLTKSTCHFLNAQGINYSLSSLYDLLASGRISPRRASTMAYISSLLLRSLPAIDNDRSKFLRQHIQALAQNGRSRFETCQRGEARLFDGSGGRTDGVNQSVIKIHAIVKILHLDAFIFTVRAIIA